LNLTDLDRRITVQSLTQTRDAYGAPVDTWASFAVVWAKEKPIRGDEYFAAQQMTAKVDTVFTIRWLSGLLETMRISYDGKYWDIRSINELGRRAGMEIYAEAVRQ
jgi:SPP1 family predicted phage head-tail adaptor